MFDALEQKWKQTEQVSLEKLSSFSGVVLWGFVGFSNGCKNYLLIIIYILNTSLLKICGIFLVQCNS